MSEHRDYERRLESWLAAGPSRAPSDSADQIKARVATTRRRPWWLVRMAGAGEARPVRPLAFAIAATVVVLVIVASGQAWLAQGPLVGRLPEAALGSHRLVEVPIDGEPIAAAWYDEAIWVATRDEAVLRIDPGTGIETGRVHVGAEMCGNLSVGAGGVWIATCGGSLARISPAELSFTTVPASGVALAFTEGSVWTLDPARRIVERRDAQSLSLAAQLQMNFFGDGLVSGFGSVWVTRQGDQSVVRIDPVSMSPVATVPVGGDPIYAAVSESAVWVVPASGHEVVRIDPLTNQVSARIDLQQSALGIAVVNDGVWVRMAGRLVSVDARTSTIQEQHELAGPTGPLSAAPNGVLAVDPEAGIVHWVRFSP